MATTPAAQASTTSLQKTALAVSMMASFLTPFMGASINIALPSIGQQFSMDAISLGWIATAYLLASAMFLVPFGRVADIYGRKKIFTSGIFIFTAASFLMVLSKFHSYD
jgi:MFS family permease